MSPRPASDHAPPRPPSRAGVILRGLRGNPLLLLLGVLTAACGAAIHARLPLLNGPPEWQWIYAPPRGFWREWLMVAARLAPAAVLLAFLARRLSPRLPERLHCAAGLAALVAWGLLYAWVNLYARTELGPTHIPRAITNDTTSGYFSVALDVGDRYPPLPELLRDYPRHQPRMPLHPSTHPPGPVLLFGGLIRLAEACPAPAEAWLGALSWLGVRHDFLQPGTPPRQAAAMAAGLLLLLGGLAAAFPLFGLVRDSLGAGSAAERAAWGAAAIWIHLPALHIFSPTLDAFYALFGLTALWCAHRIIRGGNAPAWGAACGALIAWLTFLSFTQLIWFVVIGAMLMLELAARDLPPRRACVFATSTAAVWLGAMALLKLAWGIDMLAIFRVAYELNDDFRAEVGRSYAVWLFYAPYDLLLTAGPAVALPALVLLVRAARDFRRRRIMAAWAALPIGIGALTLTGLMPGENARLYLPLAAWLPWGAALWLATRRRHGYARTVIVIIILEWAWLIVLRTTMNFIDM